MDLSTTSLWKQCGTSNLPVTTGDWETWETSVEWIVNIEKYIESVDSHVSPEGTWRHLPRREPCRTPGADPTRERSLHRPKRASEGRELGPSPAASDQDSSVPQPPPAGRVSSTVLPQPRLPGIPNPPIDPQSAGTVPRQSSLRIPRLFT